PTGQHAGVNDRRGRRPAPRNRGVHMTNLDATSIARRLGEHIISLAYDLLPGGHREGHEWRGGSVSGEPGRSLGVHLDGTKAGVWSDFATGICGDALDLVRHTLGLD